MNREQIITEFYNSKDINQAISKMQPAYLQDELKQEVFLVLCEMPEERLFQMYNDEYLKYFIVRTILNMAKSDRSTFYKKFREQLDEIPESFEMKKEDYDESLNEKLDDAIKILHWYERELLRLYSEEKNLLKISRDTNIPYRSILETIKKVKIFLKYKIRNHEL